MDCVDEGIQSREGCTVSLKLENGSVLKVNASLVVCVYTFY